MNCKPQYYSDYPASACTLTNTYAIFIALVFVLVFLWIIGGFGSIFLDNLFFRTLDFDITSTIDTFCVTVCVFLLFVFITFIMKYIGIIPNLEQRLLGVGSDSGNKKERGVKGPNYSKFIDISDSLELQGGFVANDFLTDLRAARIARGTV